METDPETLGPGSPTLEVRESVRLPIGGGRSKGSRCKAPVPSVSSPFLHFIAHCLARPFGPPKFFCSLQPVSICVALVTRKTSSSRAWRIPGRAPRIGSCLHPLFYRHGSPTLQCSLSDSCKEELRWAEWALDKHLRKPLLHNAP